MYKRCKHIAYVFVSVALVVAFAGCPKQAGEITEEGPLAVQPSMPGAEDTAATRPAPSEIQIQVITNTSSPFWEAVKEGVNDAASDLGCEANLVQNTSGQVPDQLRLMESAEAKGVDGMAVSPLDTEAISPKIDDIVDRGTPVLTIDSDCPGSKRYCYVGSDNHQAGVLLGEFANELLDNGDTCMLFVGEAGVENSQARIKGFKQTVAKEGIEVLDVMQDHSMIDRARANVEDVLQKYPDIDALVGIWSYNLPQISTAVNEQNMHGKVKVIGFDAEPATLKDLEAGKIDGTVVQHPYLFGYKSVQILFHLISDNQEKLDELVPEDKFVDTGVELVTPENLDEFKKKLDEWGIESS